MTREVVWTRPALADLRRLDRQVAQRVIAAVGRFADSGQGDVTRLTGERDEWRLRVGDWRVRLVQMTVTRQLQPPSVGTVEVRIIEIRRVRHRREAYRD